MINLFIKVKNYNFFKRSEMLNEFHILFYFPMKLNKILTEIDIFNKKLKSKKNWKILSSSIKNCKKYICKGYDLICMYIYVYMYICILVS